MIRSGPKASSATSRYGCRSAGVQRSHAASVTRPETLQRTWGSAASRADVLAPGLESAAPRISGLARWSTTKRLLGQRPRQRERGGQLAGVDEDVVGEAEPPGARRCPGRRRAGPASRRPARPGRRGGRRGACGGRRAPPARRSRSGEQEVHPADDGLHERVGVGEAQEEARLLEALGRLDGHAAVEALRAEQRAEVLGEEVALEHGHGVGDPAVGLGPVAPEVLVGVDLGVHR